MTQQTRNFSMHADGEPHKPTMLLRDNDGEYAAGFDAVLRAEEIKPQPLTPGRPNLNAHAERFVRTLRREGLDHFVIFGEKHPRHLVREFLEHYHTERPHQALDNQPRSGARSRDETGARDPLPRAPRRIAEARLPSRGVRCGHHSREVMLGPRAEAGTEPALRRC